MFELKEKGRETFGIEDAGRGFEKLHISIIRASSCSFTSIVITYLFPGSASTQLEWDSSAANRGETAGTRVHRNRDKVKF